MPDLDLWDGAAAMAACTTAADYGKVCALDRGASITALTQRFGLPHHPNPDGAPGNVDRDGVIAAWNALNGGRTGTPMSGPGVPEARAHLEAHRRALGLGAAGDPPRLTFDAPEVYESFRVNPERRTISGLLVPYGPVAKANFAKWRFTRGSVRWGDTTRIKLNLDHDHTEPVAYATRLEDTPQGVDGTFKVARGPDGDRALSMAEDHVRDGFSVEVDFDEADGWMPDPHDEDVRLVRQASLRGVALTAFPAFDDARVSRVAAMRQGGTRKMTTDETLEAEGNAPEAAFDTALERLAGKVVSAQEAMGKDLSQSIAESVAAGIGVALADMNDGGTPATVRAARYQVTREEPVYRFDGSGESIVRDAWRAIHERGTAQGDEASDRIRKYRAQSEELSRLTGHYGVQFAPQTTGTAAGIIPPGYRPDLYIPDFNKGRPFVEACARQAIPNATPFTVPKFASVASATADHVEGTNPSDGTLTFGTTTVQPQAISGRLVLSRELVDSSNPAIDTIALYEMRESYNRQTEAKVYALLNGTGGAGGTITSGFVPSGAQAATFVGSTGTPPALIAGIRARLAAYPFARFASPTAALMGQNATSILATAVDSTGRPIFPYVGATNAIGVGNAVDGGWMVDGLTFQPAWAATGTTAGDTQIFIFNRGDLWVFESPLLTFRFEEKQGPANIELNVFGYFGTALLRPVGLSGIRIT